MHEVAAGFADTNAWIRASALGKSGQGVGLYTENALQLPLPLRPQWGVEKVSIGAHSELPPSVRVQKLPAACAGAAKAIKTAKSAHRNAKVVFDRRCCSIRASLHCSQRSIEVVFEIGVIANPCSGAKCKSRRRLDRSSRYCDPAGSILMTLPVASYVYRTIPLKPTMKLRLTLAAAL